MAKVLKVLGVVFLALVILGVLFGGDEDVPAATAGDKWETPKADSMSVSRLRIPVDVERVSLDVDSRRMAIEGRIPKSAVSASGTVFVWAFFTNPGFNNGSWSHSPVRATVTGNGDTVNVRVRHQPFGWSDNPAVPRAGYRVYVVAGPDSSRLYLDSRYRQKERATSIVISQRG